MIIVEGPDASGKTSLVRKIADHVEWRVIHSGGPPKSETEMIKRVSDYINGPRNRIYDRFPVISDPIYAKVFGRDTPITSLDRWNMHRLQPLIIYCVSPHGRLTAQTNPDIDTPEHVAKVTAGHAQLKRAYAVYFGMFPPAVTYDWTNDDEILHMCKDYAGRNA